MAFFRELIESVLSRSQGASTATESGGLMQSVLGMVCSEGGLNQFLDRFRQAGHGDAVDSWVGTGENAPIEGEHVRSALGEEKIQEIAQNVGLPANETAQAVAKILPHIVDKLTPDGHVPEGGRLTSMLESLKGFGAKQEE